MREIFETVKKLCDEKEFSCFFLDRPEEIWISGYLSGKKFDIFVRKLPDGYIKLVFEIPEERKPMLFRDEKDVIKRLLFLIEEREEIKGEEQEEQIFTKITGLMSDDKLVEMYLKNRNEKREKLEKEE